MEKQVDYSSQQRTMVELASGSVKIAIEKTQWIFFHSKCAAKFRYTQHAYSDSPPLTLEALGAAKNWQRSLTLALGTRLDAVGFNAVSRQCPGNPRIINMIIIIWLVVWNMFHILSIVIPTD